MLMVEPLESERKSSAKKPMSFDEIVRTYGQELLAYVFRMTGGSDSAQDVVQEVFLSLYQKDIALDEIDNIRAYLYQMARNHILHLKRGEGRHHRKMKKVEETLGHHGELHGQLPRTLSDTFHLKEQMSLVRKIVATLPEKQREVFVLFELQEQPSAEIADILNIPHATVRSRLRLAREGFKKRFEEIQLKDSNDSMKKSEGGHDE